MKTKQKKQNEFPQKIQELVNKLEKAEKKADLDELRLPVIYATKWDEELFRTMQKFFRKARIRIKQAKLS